MKPPSHKPLAFSPRPRYRQSQLCLRLDPTLEMMPNVDGIFTRFGLVTPLASSMKMAMDFKFLAVTRLSATLLLVRGA